MASSLPNYERIVQAFAVSGNKSTLPQTATGTNNASYQEGFPPITSQPLADGGMPPVREDFNALGYASTSTLAYLQQGGLFTFDANISNLIGGYPQGAVLNYIVDNKIYRLISLINDNTYDFNADESYIGQYWDYVTDNQSNGSRSLGEIFAYPSSRPPEGAYLLNGQTIGDCQTLYPEFWEWLQEEMGEMVDTPLYKPWTMPSLTEDGTLGGDTYAAYVNGTISANYQAYKSFDNTYGAATNYTSVQGKSAELTWYSPVKLKITSLLFVTPSGGGELNAWGSTFEIFGSNDGTTWDSLISGTFEENAYGAKQTVPIPESVYNSTNVGYQYLKIAEVNRGGSYTNFPEVTIFGQEYYTTGQESNGYVRVVDALTYENEIIQYGMSGAFVISDTSVRLPTYTNAFLMGGDISNIGQTMAAGLPRLDLTNEGNVTTQGGTAVLARSGSVQIFRNLNGCIASGSGWQNTLGVGFELDKSFAVSGAVEIVSKNLIYGNSDTVQPPANRVCWCIQVYNAATELSTQESARLASEMQLKAQTDLANVISNIDFVVESYDDGQGNWYRLYRSGWLEQGGINTNTSDVPASTTFLKPFRDTKYLLFSLNHEDDTTAWSNRFGYDKTETGFSWVTHADAESDWIAIGYSA